MKKYFRISLVALGLCSTVLGQRDVASPSSSQHTVNELVKTTSQIYDAYIRRDRKAVDRYLTENFLETDATCTLRDKVWNLNNLLGIEETLKYQIEEPKVREYGNTALLFYVWIVEHGIRGKVGRTALRVTDIFVKSDNRWKLLASHRTKLNDKQDLENQLANGIRCEAR
jgi:ketosteroid isomerase-like protein